MEMKVFIGNKVDTATKRYMQDHDCDDYAVAMHEVLAKDPILRAQYAGVPIEKAPKASPSVLNYTQREIGEEVNRLVMEYMGDKEDTCSYLEALKAVLHSHPTLARKYTHG